MANGHTLDGQICDSWDWEYRRTPHGGCMLPSVL